MKIAEINNRLAFGAKIVNTSDLNIHIKFLNENLNTKPDVFSTKKNYGLLRRIMYAFNQHPSNVEISPVIVYQNGEKYGLRGGLVEEGSLKISNGIEINDIEPAKNSIISPLENIFKKLLAPENNIILDKVFGKEHTNTTKSWYNKHIQPIWEDINNIFGESSIYEHNFDKQLNQKFREENI